MVIRKCSFLNKRISKPDDVMMLSRIGITRDPVFYLPTSSHSTRAWRYPLTGCRTILKANQAVEYQENTKLLCITKKLWSRLELVDDGKIGIPIILVKRLSLSLGTFLSLSLKTVNCLKFIPILWTIKKLWQNSYFYIFGLYLLCQQKNERTRM